MRHIETFNNDNVRCVSPNYLLFKYHLEHTIEGDSFEDLHQVVRFAKRRRNEIIKSIKKEGYSYDR